MLLSDVRRIGGDIVIKATASEISISVSLTGLEKNLPDKQGIQLHHIEVFKGKDCNKLGDPYFNSNVLSVNPWKEIVYEQVGNHTYQLPERLYYVPTKVN